MKVKGGLNIEGMKYKMLYSRKRLDESKYIEVAKNYYAVIEEWDKKNSSERHLEFCYCFSERRKNLLFTGQSACSIYGIPRVDPFEVRPHCIRENTMRTDIICWRYGKTDEHARTLNGLKVVSPIRGIWDLEKYDTSYSLLTSINHCLYKKLFSKEKFLTALNSEQKRPGRKRLFKLISLATHKCESPLETLAWIAINNAGFHNPKQQVHIYDKQHFVGRVDMCWENGNNKVVLELDGLNKYEDRNVLVAEKIREDKLRFIGYELVRATWKDVRDGKLIKMLNEKNISKKRNYIRGII